LWEDSRCIYKPLPGSNWETNAATLQSALIKTQQDWDWTPAVLWIAPQTRSLCSRTTYSDSIL